MDELPFTNDEKHTFYLYLFINSFVNLKDLVLFSSGPYTNINIAQK